MPRFVVIYPYDELIRVVKPIARVNLVRFILRSGKLTPNMLDGDVLLVEDEPFLADWSTANGVWFHADGRVYMEDFVTDESDSPEG